MKRWLLLGLAACHVDLVPPWQLDHDRILAVRVTPPHIAAGEVALVDALVAHTGGVPTIEPSQGITATDAPGGLFTAVNFVFDHWEIQGRDDAALADARAELGLAADAPVPLELTVVITPALVAKKLVYLGDSQPNPDLPALLVDGALPGATLDVPIGRDVLVSAIAEDVSWFSSIGNLVDDDQPTATLHVDDAQDGEFAVVVRDAAGGVVWQVWPIRAR